MSERVAFLILAHTDPEMVGRLVRRLCSHPAVDVYIHIDVKADLAAFTAAVPEDLSVTFVAERVSVSWAAISMIDAQLSLLRAALSGSAEYARVMYLSGTDYPITSMANIVSHLTGNQDREFCKFIDMRESPDHYLRHVHRQWFFEHILSWRFGDRVLRKLLTMLKLPNRWPADLVPCFGSQWIAVTGCCARHLLEYHDGHPEFYRANRRSFSPDEHYFHTIIGNSSFAEAAGGVQPFEGSGTWRMANLHIVHPSLGKFYTDADWDEIAESDRLFVRKVRSSDGASLLDRLDATIHKNAPVV